MGFFRQLSIRNKQMLLSMLTSCAALLLACTGFVLYDVVTAQAALTQDLLSLAEVLGLGETAGATEDWLAVAAHDRKDEVKLTAAIALENFGLVGLYLAE